MIQLNIDTKETYGLNNLIEKITLDFRSGEPLYLQIVHQVELLIAEGKLKMGDQLPTVREVATELRINFNTVARAYHVLDETHLISTQRGRGTYVWDKPSAETLLQLRQKSLEEFTLNYLNQIIQLDYSPADALKTIQRLIENKKDAGEKKE
jgi:GntR family transcriptional regulator